jgi:hypothetical protein
VTRKIGKYEKIGILASFVKWRRVKILICVANNRNFEGKLPDSCTLKLNAITYK